MILTSDFGFWYRSLKIWHIMLSVNLHAKLQIMTVLAYPKETIFVKQLWALMSSVRKKSLFLRCTIIKHKTTQEMKRLRKLLLAILLLSVVTSMEAQKFENLANTPQMG